MVYSLTLNVAVKILAFATALLHIGLQVVIMQSLYKPQTFLDSTCFSVLYEDKAPYPPCSFSPLRGQVPNRATF